MVLEVKVNYTKNLINLNKKYENNLQKVVIFNVTSCLFVFLPKNTFGGTVLDNVSGQPLPGVNVNIQGSAKWNFN